MTDGWRIALRVAAVLAMLHGALTFIVAFALFHTFLAFGILFAVVKPEGPIIVSVAITLLLALSAYGVDATLPRLHTIPASD